MKILLCFFLTVALSSADDTPIEQFKTGNQLFTQDVYNQLLLDNNENILVSPFSVETLFALTQSGAKDTTAAQIRTALHLASTEEETEGEFQSVLPTIHSDKVTLITANKIFVKDAYPIKEEFKKIATNVYGADFQNIDFSASGAAAEEINKWVEKETNNKIQKVVTPDDFDSLTRVVLINALYFKGNWSSPFNGLHSSRTKFYTSADTAMDVQTMSQNAQLYNYYESEELDAQILEMPFQGGEATMTFVLPNKKEGIAVLEKQMQKVLLKPQYSYELVQVVLPKFKIESNINFKDVLEKLGVYNAFNAVAADFSGIAGDKGELYIDQAVQKTYIDVNEGGVEAVAVTTVIGGLPSVVPTPSKYFVADHPFVFYIKFKDIVLFEGRVLVPQYY